MINRLRVSAPVVLLCAFLLPALSGCRWSSVGPVILTDVVTDIAGTAVLPTETPDIESELDEIDRLLERTIPGNIAYNVPSSMQLDETTDIQLLLSPSLTDTELEEMISSDDSVRTASVEITPQMQAELWVDDPDAFDIHPYHADARQLISSQEPTEWKWAITARKGGLQTLHLTLHRLVRYDDRDHWRKVQEYKADLAVRVTFGKWLANLDWKFLVVTAVAILGVPIAVWRVLAKYAASLRAWLARRGKDEGH